LENFQDGGQVLLLKTTIGAKTSFAAEIISSKEVRMKSNHNHNYKKN